MSNTVSGKDVGGRVAAVTGAGRGIGKEAAAALAAAGVNVAMGDLDYGHVERAASAINHTITRDGGGAAIALGLDVRDPESFRRFLDEARRDFGPIDILVNCAGVSPAGPLLGESLQSAHAAFEVNVGGVLTALTLVLPDMTGRRSGHVITVGSYAGVVPEAGHVLLSATRSALHALTRGARYELSGSGVSFTTVVPTSSAGDDEVAAAIVAAVGSRAGTVYVPARARQIGAAVGVLPYSMRRRIYRAMRAKASPAGQ